MLMSAHALANGEMVFWPRSTSPCLLLVVCQRASIQTNTTIWLSSASLAKSGNVWHKCRCRSITFTRFSTEAVRASDVFNATPDSYSHLYRYGQCSARSERASAIDYSLTAMRHCCPSNKCWSKPPVLSNSIESNSEVAFSLVRSRFKL